MTQYTVIARDTGVPSLPNDSVIAGLNPGATFTATLDPAVEAELIAAGLIARYPAPSPVYDSSAAPKGIDSTGVADTNVLAYDAASGKFKPGAGGGGGSPTGAAGGKLSGTYPNPGLNAPRPTI